MACDADTKLTRALSLRQVGVSGGRQTDAAGGCRTHAKEFRMKKTLALALVASLLATPVFAADVCNVPADKAQSKDVLKAQLEKDGWTVRQIKDDKGCYEAYAVKADGTRMENLFDPETLKMLDVEAD
jgi:hypothetical protein